MKYITITFKIVADETSIDDGEGLQQVLENYAYGQLDDFVI